MSDLVPGIQSWGGFSKPAPAPESHGRTVQNTPEERPDPKAVAAVDAERVKRRVQNWINDDLATLRVGNGTADPYFGDLKRALQHAAVNPPKFETDPVHKFFRDWSNAAQRYARGAPPEGLADGGAALMAVVELRQSATGELLTSLLLKSSGNNAFDEHVMRSAPKAILELPSPRPGGPGIHLDGLRSQWAFEGRVQYRKKLKDVHLKDDWLALAAASPLSLLSGGFDETNGDVYVVDLHNPTYTCTVRLLRVY